MCMYNACCHCVGVIEVGSIACFFGTQPILSNNFSLSFFLPPPPPPPPPSHTQNTLSLSLSLSSPLLFLCDDSSLFYRAKLYKLQHPGKELVFSDMKPPAPESEQQGWFIGMCKVKSERDGETKRRGGGGGGWEGRKGE